VLKIFKKSLDKEYDYTERSAAALIRSPNGNSVAQLSKYLDKVSDYKLES